MQEAVWRDMHRHRYIRGGKRMSFGAALNLGKAGSASSVYFNIIVAGEPEWSSFPGGQNSPLRYHFLVYWGGWGALVTAAFLLWELVVKWVLSLFSPVLSGLFSIRFPLSDLMEQV